MRRYEVIPLPELRRQYRREREFKESMMSSLLLLPFTVAATLIYLFF